MKKDRILPALLLSIIMMLVPNMLRADDAISQIRILGGELSNSAATSVKDIEEVLPRMKTLGLNTVLMPVYWELLEPVEDEMDFTLVDGAIDVARRQGLKIVPLWFGAWKNSMSCYAPGWFKQSPKRFPRAMTAEGKQMEIASCFSDDVLQADLKAFSALMRHIKERDPQREVVIMMQIENEIGMLESARDHSPLAEKAYRQERWAERYGTDEYADEKFMALSYARYVEHLARAAREIHDMPLYVNAAMNSRGRRPGEYPSAGPLERIISDEGVMITSRHFFTLPWDSRATDGSTWPEGGAMLIRLGKYDYLLAGSGVVVDFKTPTEKQQEEKKQLGEDGFAEAGGNKSPTLNRHFNGKRLGLLSVDEVSISDDGTMQYLRRHNGDQTHQGRHARIGVGEWKLLHIRLYEY